MDTFTIILLVVIFAMLVAALYLLLKRRELDSYISESTNKEKQIARNRVDERLEKIRRNLNEID